MKIFISYAADDLDKFNIPKIARELEKETDIEQVFYWHRDNQSSQSIVDYMEKSIEKADIIMVFCSEISLESAPVKTELQMALYLNKNTIPVFDRIDHVPLMLKIKRGVKFNSNDFELFFNELLIVLGIKETKEQNILIEEIATEVKEYYDFELYAPEAEFMKELEKLIRTEIPFLDSLKIFGNSLCFFCEDKHIKKLSIYKKKLSFLPESINNLTQLRELYIEKNLLSFLPKSIGDLKYLTKLNLANNKISSIPEEICNLKNLTSLTLTKNKISSLPNSIGELSNLIYLNIVDNKITFLPESIGNLKHLRTLLIFTNKVQSLPESIGNLKELRILYINGNKISSLPKSITNLLNLKELFLNSNEFETFSEDINKWLRKIKKRGCKIMR